MTRSYFIDHAHFDPCRVCRGTFFRDEMIAAKDVKVFGRQGVWKRGWVCRRCAFRTSGEEQQILFHDVPDGGA